MYVWIDGCTVHCGGGLVHQQDRQQQSLSQSDDRLIPHLVYSSPWKRLVGAGNTDPAPAGRKTTVAPSSRHTPRFTKKTFQRHLRDTLKTFKRLLETAMRQARDTLRDNKETRLRKPKFTQETLPEIYTTDSRNYHEKLQETCKRPPVDNPRDTKMTPQR